jgi:hypothetical protein
MSDPREWTIEQATEVCLEQTLALLDGIADDDAVRPALVLEAIRDAWAPTVELSLPDELTAGELRAIIARARARLAAVGAELDALGIAHLWVDGDEFGRGLGEIDGGDE